MSSVASPAAPAHREMDPYDAGVRIEGAGPPLVLVLGMDGTGELFYQQVPKLARDYRVATYALRDDATDMSVLIEDLARVVREVGGGVPATIIGESFGGTLSMSFALAHPELVRRLVIINSFAYFAPQHLLVLARLGIRLIPWGAMALVRRLTAFRMHSPHTHEDEIRRFLEITSRTTRAGYLSRLRILRGLDLRPRLAAITAPTLLLAADNDHLVPSVGQATLMVDRLPDVTMRILHGHGHVCLISGDLDLSAILREWLAASPVDESSPTLP